MSLCVPTGDGLIIYITHIAHITYTFIAYIARESLITYMHAYTHTSHTLHKHNLLVCPQGRA